MVYLLITFILFFLILNIICRNTKLGIIYTTKIGFFLLQKTKEKGFSLYGSEKDMIINKVKYQTYQVSLHVWDSQITFISNKMKEVKPDPYQLGLMEGNLFMEREQVRILNKVPKEYRNTVKKFKELDFTLSLMDSKIFE